MTDGDDNDDDEEDDGDDTPDDEPYLFNTTSVTFTISSGLPTTDTNGLLQFDLTYYAFGNSTIPNATPWIIRNGLIRTMDKTGSNGSFLPVQIGAGKKDEFGVEIWF